MFVVQDVLIEAIVVTVVLLALLLSAAVIASAGGEWMERRRAQAARTRLRRRVWNEYATACAPLQPLSAPAARPPATVRAEPATRPVDRQAGLSARPAKA